MSKITRWWVVGSWCVVALVALQPMIGFAAEKPLKIVSYNVLNGMKLDETPEKDAFVAWFKRVDPDILGLQEAQQLTQKSLEEMARKFGHPYAVLQKETGHPIALTSKYPIVNVSRVTDSMHHGFIRAEIAGYNIIVTHLSPHKFWKRREEVALLLATMQNAPKGKPWILMGDLNAESPLDAEMYKDGKLALDRRKAEEKYATHQNLVDGKLDFKPMDAMLSAGLVDVVRARNKGALSSQPTRRFAAEDGRGTPRRVDYIYIDKSVTGVEGAGILKDEFTDQYSDHYPVWLTLRR